MRFKICLAALCAVTVSACNPMDQLEQSEQKVTNWQSSFNNGDAEAMYRQAGPQFRDAMTEDQMRALVNQVTDRMGAIESSERDSFNISAKGGPTVTTIVMASDFEKGDGTETFVFHGTGDDLEIVAWNVDSPNFLIDPNGTVADVEPESAN